MPFLQRHLLAIQPQSLTEAVEAESEYLQIKPSATYGASIRQVEEETTPDQVQTAQKKLSAGIAPSTTVPNFRSRRVERDSKNYC